MSLKNDNKEEIEKVIQIEKDKNKELYIKRYLYNYGNFENNPAKCRYFDILEIKDITPITYAVKIKMTEKEKEDYNKIFIYKISLFDMINYFLDVNENRFSGGE